MDQISFSGKFEQRVQSVIQIVIVALLIGIGTALLDLVKSNARQEVTNAQTAKDISDLKTEMAVLRLQVTNAALAAANAATAVAVAAAATAAAAQNRRGSREP